MKQSAKDELALGTSFGISDKPNHAKIGWNQKEGGLRE